MRPRVVSAAVFAVLILVSGLRTAGAQIEDHPGYFPIDRFSILAEDSLSLEINLNKALLRLVAAAVGDEEPEFAELVRGLESIRVRVAEPGAFDVAALRGGLAEATDWLESRGWSTMLRLREEEEEVYVYLRATEDEMQGITVLAMEADGEAVLVNVVGSLDPERLASLAEALDIPQLGLAAGLDESARTSDEEDQP